MSDIPPKDFGAHIPNVEPLPELGYVKTLEELEYFTQEPEDPTGSSKGKARADPDRNTSLLPIYQPKGVPRGRVRFATPYGERDRSPARDGLGANDTSTAANFRTGMSTRTNGNSPSSTTTEQSHAPSFGESSTAVDTQPTAGSLRSPPKRRYTNEVDHEGFENVELKAMSRVDHKPKDNNRNQVADPKHGDNPVTPTSETVRSVQADGMNAADYFYSSIESGFRFIGALVGMIIEFLAMSLYRTLRMLLPHSREEAGVSIFFASLFAAQIYVACILDLPNAPPHWIATVVSALVGTGSAGIIAAWRTRIGRPMQAGHWFFVVSCIVVVEMVAMYLLRNVKVEETGESVVSEVVKRMLDG